MNGTEYINTKSIPDALTQSSGINVPSISIIRPLVSVLLGINVIVILLGIIITTG